MTIDERLEKLRERQEALVATIELDHREFRENFALTAQAIKDLLTLAQSHEERLDEQRERSNSLDQRMGKFHDDVELMRVNFDARLKRLEPNA